MVMVNLPDVRCSTCALSASIALVLARGLPQVASFQLTVGPSTVCASTGPAGNAATHKAAHKRANAIPSSVWRSFFRPAVRGKGTGAPAAGQREPDIPRELRTGR